MARARDLVFIVSATQRAQMQEMDHIRAHLLFVDVVLCIVGERRQHANGRLGDGELEE